MAPARRRAHGARPEDFPRLNETWPSSRGERISKDEAKGCEMTHPSKRRLSGLLGRRAKNLFAEGYRAAWAGRQGVPSNPPALRSDEAAPSRREPERARRGPCEASQMIFLLGESDARYWLGAFQTFASALRKAVICSIHRGKSPPALQIHPVPTLQIMN